MAPRGPRLTLMRAQSLVFFATLCFSAGCHTTMPPDQALMSLESPDPEVRRHGADALRTERGVPPEAVAPLLEALESERDPQVRGAILITLGRSGSSEAKPLIDRAVQTASAPDERRWALRALKYWELQNGVIPPNERAQYWIPWGVGGPTTPAPTEQ
jgi:hypothetical protein